MRQSVPNWSSRHAFEYAIGLLAVTAAFALAGCGGSSGESSDAHDQLTSLCEKTTNRDSGYCGCVADESIKLGYDTDAEIQQLQDLVQSISQTGAVSQLPDPVVQALNSCGAAPAT